jgi:hypothetical protein
MSDTAQPTDQPTDPITELREHAEALERRLTEVTQQADARLIRAELKAEALHAGMIDLDGLKLIDAADLKLLPSGEVDGAAELMTRLKRAKPWLFGGKSSSSHASPPPAQPPRQKLATEMTDDEYRAARAAVLKHRP